MANATSMAELMAKKAPSIRSFKKGEKVTGTITKLTKNEILVDIGAKTEASVLEKDKAILSTILSSLKVGDKVEVGVLNPESDQGNPVVSLRKYVDEKVWGGLEKLSEDKKIVEVTVNDHTKGGFMVSSDDGLSGFLPNSQIILNDNPQKIVGNKINAVILEINRAQHKVIFSQKAATSDSDFKKLIKDIKVDGIYDVVVSSTTSFGVFVSVKNTEGFIHLSELSWDRIDTAENLYKVGDEIKAKVIGIDNDGRRVNMSVKRLTKDPFESLADEYKIDKKVKGEVKQVNSLGVIVDLGEVEALIKKDKIPAGTKYTKGQTVEATVSEVDVKRHRIIIAPVLKEKPMGYR